MDGLVKQSGLVNQGRDGEDGKEDTVKVLLHPLLPSPAA